MAAHDYDVRVSPLLGPKLREWKAIAEANPQTAAGLAYQTIKSAVDKVISDPDLAGSPRTRLRSELHPVCRLKGGPKSRFRLFYIFSDEKKLAIVLWLGYRREGDPCDAYAEFERMLAAGAFDAQFEELNLALPTAAGTRRV